MSNRLAVLGRLTEDRDYGALVARDVLARVHPEPNSDCWLWTGAVGGRGDYAHIRLQGVVIAVHKVTYAIWRGVVGGGLELDHLCRVTICVNPFHLDPVPHRLNMLRGLTNLAAVQSARTACPRGHAYDLVEPGPYGEVRRCYRCRRAQQAAAKRRWRARQVTERVVTAEDL